MVTDSQYHAAMTTSRVGFCCKWIDDPGQIAGISKHAAARRYNMASTTVAWLNRQTPDQARQKLWDLMVHNVEAARALVQRVGQLDPHARMVRLGSDILPCYTEPTWQSFWQQPDVQAYLAQHLIQVGDLAREHAVRLSMHPGQFVVLASHSDDIIERSLAEFEYHTDVARHMGYGQHWHDHGFKINVHLTGRAGPEQFRKSWHRLTPESRNLIAVENDEFSQGLDDVLDIADLVAITLDVHHHWVATGEYMDHQDVRLDRVLASWRGVRPVMHYSLSREDVLPGHDPDVKPDLAQLLSQGLTRSKLRAHSNYYWNRAVTAWVAGFHDRWDIQLESKAKNLARDQVIQSFLAG